MATGQIFNAFLEHLRSTAKSEHEKGELFESAIRDYLQQSLAIAVWIKNIVVLIKASVCSGD